MQAVQVTPQDMRAAISREGRSMVPNLQSIFQVCPAAFLVVGKHRAERYVMVHSLSHLQHILQECSLRSAVRSTVRQACWMCSAAT